MGRGEEGRPPPHSTPRGPLGVFPNGESLTSSHATALLPHPASPANSPDSGTCEFGASSLKAGAPSFSSRHASLLYTTDYTRHLINPSNPSSPIKPRPSPSSRRDQLEPQDNSYLVHLPLFDISTTTSTRRSRHPLSTVPFQPLLPHPSPIPSTPHLIHCVTLTGNQAVLLQLPTTIPPTHQPPHIPSRVSPSLSRAIIPSIPSH